jgi:hypothetical protein
MEAVKVEWDKRDADFKIVDPETGEQVTYLYGFDGYWHHPNSAEGQRETSIVRYQAALRPTHSMLTQALLVSIAAFVCMGLVGLITGSFTWFLIGMIAPGLFACAIAINLFIQCTWSRPVARDRFHPFLVALCYSDRRSMF